MLLSKAKSEFVRHYMVKNNPRNTIERYHSFMLHLLRFFGEVDVEMLNVPMIDEFREKQIILRGLSEGTMNYELGILRAFLSFMDKVHPEIRCLKSKQIEYSKVAAKEIKVPTPEQIDRMLTLPDESEFMGSRDAAILSLFLTSGLRVSELTGLNKDLDLDKPTFLIVGKGRKLGKCFLSPKTVEKIRNYLKKRGKDPSPALFISKRSHSGTRDLEDMGRLSNESVQNMVRKYAKKTGIKVTPHTLRHFFLTDLSSKGVELAQVQEYARHTSPVTTRRYVHFASSLLEETYKKVHS